LFLAIPLAIYFTLYISNQTGYIANRDFRQLASVSLQVEERIENLKEAFGNAVENTVEKNFEGQQATKNAVAKTGAQPSPSPSLPPTFKQSLAALGAGFVTDDEPRIPKYTNPEELKRDLHTRQVGMEVNTGGETSELVFICEMKHFLPDTKPTPELIRFTATIKLDDIVNPLIGERHIESIRGSEHEEGFDSILIASLSDNKETKSAQEGSEPGAMSKVIFQQGTPELDIDSLDNLPRADGNDKIIDFKVVSRSTSSTDVRLADTTYKVYLQPLEIPLPTAAPDGHIPNGQVESRWVICGLVQASHFRRETWAFPYTMLIMLGFVTALVALSWPFLKLLFGGPKDRLRLADVYFVAFALFIGSAVLTFFLLFGLTYIRSEFELDQQLQTFSEEIAGHFWREVNDANDEINDLNRDAELRESLKKIEEDYRAKQTSLRKGLERTNILKTHENDTYPYFTTAIWMSPEGQQRLKWTINPHTSNYIPVGDRDYFKKVMDGGFRGSNGPESNEQQSDAQKFWLEPIESRFTAAKTVIISKPIRSDDPNHSGEIQSVAAFDPRLMSLLQTVVPSGFGYRVIDNSGHDPGDENMRDPGKVIFQSSESQQLKENFFEECDNNHSLRSLVFGRVNGFVNVNYRGEEHRLYVSPIKGFANWSLIVFRNKQPLRTVFLETQTLAGSIFLFYAIILLIIFVVIYLIKTNSPDRTEWIWPSEEMSGIYYQSFLVNLALILLSFIVILTLDGKWAIFWICGLAFFAIIHLAVRLKGKWFIKRLDRIVGFLRINKLFQRRDAYIWNVFLLLVIIGILPAVAFFKVAYNEEMKLFVKHGQLTIAQGLEAREARIRSQYSTERVDPMNNPAPITDRGEAKKFIDQRLQKNLDIYDDFFFRTTRAPAKNEHERETPDSLLVFFNFYVPFFNETSIQMGGLVQKQAADRSWWWENSSSHEIALHIPKPGGEPLHLTTPLQRFGAPAPYLLFWGLGFLIILLILFYLTRTVIRKVFLLDADRALNLSRLPEDKSSIKENFFVVQSWPWSHRDNFPQTNQVCRIDLAIEARGEDWVEKIESRIQSEKPKTVVVDHFECQIDNPSMSLQKLCLIEWLMTPDRIVVIMSSTEPVAYSFNSAAGKAKKELKGEANVCDRWAEIISRFRKVYSVENDDAEIKTALSNLQDRLDSDPKIPEEDRKRVLKLAQFVQKECAPQPCLHHIGEQIIEQLGSEEMKPGQILDQVLDQAEMFYQRVWDMCSKPQQLTLLHLAEDRFLSPNDPDTKSLLRKGIIERAPDLGLINETFRRFVLSRSLPGSFETVETEARNASPWEALKVPLLVIFVGVALFLFLTQKDFYGSSWTLVTGLTTGIPVVFKVLGLFQGEGAGRVYNA